MDLGNTIRTLRKQKGFTQGNFASRCEITQTYLSQIELNQKEPTIAIIKAISTNLDIPLPILFFLSMGDEDVHPEKKTAYKIMEPAIKSFVNEFFTL